MERVKMPRSYARHCAREKLSSQTFKAAEILVLYLHAFFDLWLDVVTFDVEERVLFRIHFELGEEKNLDTISLSSNKNPN